MIAKSSLKIGGTQIEFECNEQEDMLSLHKAIVLGNPRSACNVCKVSRIDSPDTFRLDTNRDKEGNTYVNVVCSCGAKSKLGQYKIGGYFWHDFEVYVKGGDKTD